MKTLLMLVCFLSLHAGALTPGGDHVGSGGGIAEKNVVFAYANLDKYIPLCLGSDVCRLQPAEKRLRTAIPTNNSLRFHTTDAPTHHNVVRPLRPPFPVAAPVTERVWPSLRPSLLICHSSPNQTNVVVTISLPPPPVLY